jgi:hypothetical protein
MLYQIIVYEILPDKNNRFLKTVNYELPAQYISYSKTFLFDNRKDRKSDKSLILLSRIDVVCFDFSNPE